ncbi:uncharacterized protein LOC124430193 [Vespa crabro]|uniref:uncharacterized protein LOC124430193 n=1 Tax=Vespa crabro TaxID=7445 RepID=UPI001F0164E5|nr:uncharacterized protein LOC124430193 [Vespa crabro]
MNKMKSIFVFCGILIALCLFWQVEGNCQWNDETLSVGEHIRDCTRIFCNESGHLSALPCPVYTCEEIIGYEDKDLSKPFPECCGGPICKS